MRTLQIAVYALACVFAGCGDVGEEGATDADGCPVRMQDWTGTATLETNCTAPATYAVPGGLTGHDGSNPGHPRVVSISIDEAANTCDAHIAIPSGCNDGETAYYTLKVPRH